MEKSQANTALLVATLAVVVANIAWNYVSQLVLISSP